MKLSGSISYLKAQAKVIVQDIEPYEETQQSLALLKLLAQSSKNKREGNYMSAKQSFKRLCDRVKALK